MSACVQDAAGKVQGAAQTQYDYAKDTASNLADKTQGHAQGAHGQAKVSLSHLLLSPTDCYVLLSCCQCIIFEVWQCLQSCQAKG